MVATLSVGAARSTWPGYTPNTRRSFPKGPASMNAVTPDRLTSATWDDIARLYQPLVDQPLDARDPDQIEQWLAEWSALDSALIEASTLAMADASGDANDPVKEATHLRFASDFMPKHA